MWSTLELKHLAPLPGVRTTRVDFCQYGEEYHKTTKLMSYGFAEIDAIGRRCTGKGGLCSRTGKPHELLSGAVECPPDKLHLVEGCVRCPGKGVKPRPMARPAPPTPVKIWKTKLAEPYPMDLCDAAVSYTHLTLPTILRV